MGGGGPRQEDEQSSSSSSTTSSTSSTSSSTSASTIAYTSTSTVIFPPAADSNSAPSTLISTATSALPVSPAADGSSTIQTASGAASDSSASTSRPTWPATFTFKPPTPGSQPTNDIVVIQAPPNNVDSYSPFSTRNPAVIVLAVALCILVLVLAFLAWRFFPSLAAKFPWLQRLQAKGGVAVTTVPLDVGKSTKPGDAGRPDVEQGHPEEPMLFDDDDDEIRLLSSASSIRGFSPHAQPPSSAASAAILTLRTASRSSSSGLTRTSHDFEGPGAWLRSHTAEVEHPHHAPSLASRLSGTAYDRTTATPPPSANERALSVLKGAVGAGLPGSANPSLVRSIRSLQSWDERWAPSRTPESAVGAPSDDQGSAEAVDGSGSSGADECSPEHGMWEVHEAQSADSVSLLSLDNPFSDRYGVRSALPPPVFSVADPPKVHVSHLSPVIPATDPFADPVTGLIFDPESSSLEEWSTGRSTRSLSMFGGEAGEEGSLRSCEGVQPAAAAVGQRAKGRQGVPSPPECPPPLPPTAYAAPAPKRYASPGRVPPVLSTAAAAGAVAGSGSQSATPVAADRPRGVTMASFRRSLSGSNLVSWMAPSSSASAVSSSASSTRTVSPWRMGGASRRGASVTETPAGEPAVRGRSGSREEEREEGVVCEGGGGSRSVSRGRRMGRRTVSLSSLRGWGPVEGAKGGVMVVEEPVVAGARRAPSITSFAAVYTTDPPSFEEAVGEGAAMF
ncbi:hypothetical protein HDU96_003370 [Phlyctochytrium bullatum]|nr:hypothetical protein HDU96_003370 [Phlyctochytrium bullatum]